MTCASSQGRRLTVTHCPLVVTSLGTAAAMPASCLPLLLPLLLLVLGPASVSAILNPGLGPGQCREQVEVATRHNVTRMVPVTDTLSELCFSLQEGFRCNRQVNCAWLA